MGITPPIRRKERVAMTRERFITEYTRVFKLALRLAEKALREGIASLEEETEDIDDELFKQGLRFVVDGIEAQLIDEIMSNRIAHETDKDMRLLKSVQKRAIRGIQAGENLRVFYHVLLSLPDLTAQEEREIEDIVWLADELESENAETGHHENDVLVYTVVENAHGVRAYVVGSERTLPPYIRLSGKTITKEEFEKEFAVEKSND
jgi:hypothetical protein